MKSPSKTSNQPKKRLIFSENYEKDETKTGLTFKNGRTYNQKRENYLKHSRTTAQNRV